MATPVRNDDSNGIFHDAINLSSSDYSLVNFESQHGLSNIISTDELGMLVGDGIFLCPSEAQIFKRVQKIVAENNHLKDILKDNSARLQSHVEDCIRWKRRHKSIEDGLRSELETEKESTLQLKFKLENLTAALQVSSLPSSSRLSMEESIVPENKQSERSFASLDSNREGKEMENQHLSRISNNKISANNIPQIPLAQFIELQQRMDTIVIENCDLKKQLNFVKELKIQTDQLKKERGDLLERIAEKDRRIQHMALEMEDLRNLRSVEVLDITPQQQSKEINQLEANMESYKSKIKNLEAQNKRIAEDLDEISDSFEKVEEENTEYLDQIRELKEEMEKLKQSIKTSGVDEEVIISLSDLQLSDGSPNSHQLLEEIAEKDRTINSLSRDLEKITEEKSKLESNCQKGIDTQGKLKEELNMREKEILETKINLRDKEVELSNSMKLLEEREILGGENANIIQHLEKLTQKDKEVNSLLLDLKVARDENSKLNNLIKEAMSNSQESNDARLGLMNAMSLKDKEIITLKEKLMTTESELNNVNELLAERETKIKENLVEYEKKKTLLKRREAKDADKIDAQKKEIIELREVITNLQTVINKNVHRKNKDDSDSEVKPSYFISAVDVEMSSIESSLSDSILVVTDDDNEGSSNLSTSKTKVAMREELLSTLKTENDELKMEVAILKSRVEKLPEEYSLDQCNVQNLSKQHHSLEENFQKAKKSERLTDASENDISRFNEVQGRCVSLEIELNAVVKKYETASNEIEKLRDIDNNNEELLNFKINELNFLRHQLETQQQNCEKLKRDNQQFLADIEAKADNLKNLEVKVKKCTAELIAAKKIIAQKDQELRVKEQDVEKMRNDLEEMQVLRMQLDVYRNDFQTERDCREKQQGNIIELTQNKEQLEIENYRLREEIERRGDQSLRRMQQRHGNQTTMGQWPNQKNSGLEITGKGNEQRNSAVLPQQNRQDEAEQRNCPKCHQLCPDLDSLQIHVMECLDK